MGKWFKNRRKKIYIVLAGLADKKDTKKTLKISNSKPKCLGIRYLHPSDWEF